MPQLREVTELVDLWYPRSLAEDWDAVGVVWGEPAQEVRRVLLAVDAVLPVAEEAVDWNADLLLTHHPLFLRPVNGFSADDPKGRTLYQLATAGCALMTAHTNADHAVGGVSDALAASLGVTNVVPIRGDAEPGSGGSASGEAGVGRVGSIVETTLAAFAATVSAALPPTAHGVRVAGDPEMPVRRVAVCGGAGDFLLDQLATSDIDVYVTSDLRHHRAQEFLERGLVSGRGSPALIDVAHWASEWTWLPTVAERIQARWGDTVEVRVSTTVTDPWSFRS
jgi:dinuclear metal center YbgI/SA1388 family protein